MQGLGVISCFFVSEAAGILAWAVDGCRMWLEEKRLVTPAIVDREIAQYKYEQDSIAQFLEEKTESDEFFQVENSQLFEAYRDTAGRTTNSSSHIEGLARSWLKEGLRRRGSLTDIGMG